jgi:DNA-binding MarR family transcriptional regulator
MTTLSDTQLVILSAAAQRDDRNVLPLPGSLRGGAANKVVGALLKRRLIAETVTDQLAKADAALNRIWRNDEDGRAILLHITDAGLAAIGVDPEQPVPGTAPTTRRPRTGTKQARLIEMLRAEGGASIDEIAAALQWRPHTVRGALAGALKKRLGLTITSEKIEARGRIYRIADD